MRGLDPRIPLRRAQCAPKRDGRDKPGHDRIVDGMRATAAAGNLQMSRTSFHRAAAVPKSAVRRTSITESLMTTSATCAVEPLLPVELGTGKVKFAQGMKAGRWVFATGLMAQDFVNGIAPNVLAAHAPHAGLPKREKEALRIFENLDAVLRAAGTDRGTLVRTDQYYTTVKAVPPYQQVRREFLRGRIPPSTSIAQQGLLLPGADMNIQAMAAIPGT